MKQKQKLVTKVLKLKDLKNKTLSLITLGHIQPGAGRSGQFEAL